MKNQIKRLLAQQIQLNRRKLQEWYNAQAREAPPPFYCSVDLRDSGHKVVPVDSNLYPAGFNNICPEDLRTAPSIFQAQLAEAIGAQLDPASPKKILILPETHTQNSNYIENIHYLSRIVLNAGHEARVGWFGPMPPGTENDPVLHLRSATDKEVDAFPVHIDETGALRTEDFAPDAILLNNDFSGGYPNELDRVRQPIIPSHRVGWHSRRKSEHFRNYNELARQFAEIIEVDPWHVQVDTRAVNPVDFNEGIGMSEVALAAGDMLEKLRADYEARNINRRPFVFIKNNAGTYGMGIMTAHSVDEITHMNRRSRNKMSVGKNRKQIDSVVVQEGIATATLVDRLAAEPVIYLMGCQLIGGFLRTNTERSDEENLNSSGMVFRKLCMSDLRRLDEADPDEDTPPLRDTPLLELVYGSIARISALAAGRELRDLRGRLGPSPQ